MKLSLSKTVKFSQECVVQKHEKLNEKRQFYKKKTAILKKKVKIYKF